MPENDTYLARLYRPNSGHPISAELRLVAGSMEIRAEDGSSCVSLLDLDLELGGHDSDRVKLKDKLSGAVLLCESKDFVAEIARHGNYPICIAAQQVHSKIKGSWINNKFYWGKVAVLVVGGLLGLYLAVDFAATSAFMNLSPDMESKLGSFLVESKIKRPGTLNSGAGYDRVNKVAKRLISQIKDKKYEFKFYVDSDKTLNACAYPGGTMFVNQGLLDKASDDELAGVMGHELGHVVRRHTLKSFAHSLGLWTMLRLLCMTFGEGDVDKVAAAMNLGQKLEALQFSRSQEAEADKIGTELAVDSGYRGDALISFFDRLQKDPSTADNKFFALLSDHPMNTERIDAVKAELAQLKAAGKNINGAIAEETNAAPKAPLTVEKETHTHALHKRKMRRAK